MFINCPTCLFNKNSELDTICQACGSPLAIDTHIKKLLHGLPIGTSLQNRRYIIEGILGQGGFGITYDAQDLQYQEQVVIKEYWPESAARNGTTIQWPYQITREDKKKELNKVQDEGDLLKKFKHPNIVGYRNCFLENETAYLVMELIQGETLESHLLSHGKISEQNAKLYFKDILSALSYLHTFSDPANPDSREGFLHRDIKPSNIIITPNNKAVLIDFGNTRSFISNKTDKMTRLLTPAYAPLEQYLPKAIWGPYTDIYALCASIYESVTGITAPDATERQQLDLIKPPRDIVPNIDPIFEKVLLIGLNLDVKKRFQSCQDIISALDRGVLPKLAQSFVFLKNKNISQGFKLHQQALEEYRDTPLYQKRLVENMLISLYVKPHLDENKIRTLTEKILESDASNQDAKGTLAVLACRNSEWKIANNHLGSISSVSQNKYWILLYKAWCLGNLEEMDQASKILDIGLSLEISPPNLLHIELLTLRAWVESQLLQWKTVLKSTRMALLKAQKLSLDNQELLDCLSSYLCLSLYHLTGLNSLDLDRALDRFSNQLGLHTSAICMWIYAMRENWNYSLDLAEKMTKSHKKTSLESWNLWNLAVIYERSDLVDCAIELYEDYHSRHSHDFDINYKLAIFSINNEKWEKAELYLDEAIKANPECAEAYHQLGWVSSHIREDAWIKNPKKMELAYRKAMTLYTQTENTEQAEEIRQRLMSVGISLD